MVTKASAADMCRFVIVNTQRTGSTHLVKLLDSHPSILCAGEIFYPPSGSEYAIQKYINQKLSRKIRNLAYRSGLVEEFLDDFYKQGTPAVPGGSFGSGGYGGKPTEYVHKRINAGAWDELNKVDLCKL